jgi:hypothetical protein
VRIISPLGELDQELLPTISLAGRLKGATVGVIQLRGAAEPFVDRIVERLSTEFEPSEVIRYMKDVDMAPSPTEVLDDLAARADLVLSAYGH